MAWRRIRRGHDRPVSEDPHPKSPSLFGRGTLNGSGWGMRVLGRERNLEWVLFPFAPLGRRGWGMRVVSHC